MKSVADHSVSPEIEALARKLDRPYTPGRSPWLIGLILTLAIHCAIIIRIVLQPPALDNDKPPALGPLSSDAALMYLDGTQGDAASISFPRADTTTETPRE